MSHPRCLRWLSVWLGGCLLPAYANCTSPTSPLDAPISPDMGSRRRVDLADAMAADDNTLLTHLRCCTMFPAAELPCAEFRADTCAACGCTANATCDNGAELGRFRCRMPPTTDLICNGPLGVSESVSLCASDATCCNRKYEHFEHGGVFIDNELWEYLWLIDPHPEIWPHIFMLALTTSFLVGRYSKRRKRKTRIKKRFGHMTHRHVSLIRTFSRCRFVGKQRVSPPRLKCRRRAVARYFLRKAWRHSKPSLRMCAKDTKLAQTQNEYWSNFSENYMNLMTSSRFDGGAVSKGAVPRRKRHKRNVEDENKVGELTRDVIACLKKSLNSGYSMEQLLTLLSTSLSQMKVAQVPTSKAKRKKNRQKQKSQTVSKREPAASAASEVKYWSDNLGRKHAYTVDKSGWWSWLPPKQEPQRAPVENPGNSTKTVVTQRLVGRDSKWVSSLRLSDWNTSVPPKLISFNKLKFSLKEGIPVDGNIVEIWDSKTLTELQTLWACFEKKEGMTALLCGNARSDTPGVCYTRVSVCRGAYGQKLEDLALLKIGNGIGPWLPTSQKVDFKTIPKVERQTLRVAAPSFYRAPFIGAEAEDSPSEIIKSLALLAEVPVSEFMGGRWSTQSNKFGRQFVVFLRLKKDMVAKMLKLSGQSGLFMTHVSPKPPDDFVPFWVTRNGKESDETYFRRILALKQTRNQPVIFRFGPNDNLGFQKKESDKHPVKVRCHTVQGVPRSWGEDDMKVFLQEQQWSEITNLVRRRQNWTFMGKAPADLSSRTFWQYDAHDPDDSNAVTCSIAVHVAVRSQNQPEVRKAVQGPKRIKTLKEYMPSDPKYCPENDHEVLPDANKETEKTPAAIAPQPGAHAGKSDAGTDEKLDETPENAEIANRHRSRSPLRKSVPPTVPDTPTQDASQQALSPGKIEQGPPKKPKVSEPSDPTHAMNEFGWRHWDQGGSGDCLFRVASLFEKDHDQQPSADDSRRQGSWLRAQTCSHIRKHASRFQVLFPDKKTFEAWVTSAGQHNTWAEGKAMQALSEKLGRPIVVWEKKTEDETTTYTRLVIAPRFSKGFACCARDVAPICTMLHNKHYTALVPPKKATFPSSWLRETPNTVIDLEGGVERSPSVGCKSFQKKSADSIPDDAVSVATPSVHSQVDCQPATSPGAHTPKHPDVQSPMCPDSDGTPSVHSHVPVGPETPVTKRKQNHFQNLTKEKATPSVHTCMPATIATPAEASSLRISPADEDQQPLKAVRLRRKTPPVRIYNQDDQDVLHQESHIRPDVAPYPRQLPHNKQKWDETKNLPQNEQSWRCPLCKTHIHVPAGPGARIKMRSMRSNHIYSRHTKEERKKIPRLGNTTEVITPSAHLPPDTRNWSCPLCDKGLPLLSKCWHEAAVREHFKKEHPETTPTLAYHKKQREAPDLRKRMSARGHHVGAVKRRKAVENLDALRTDSGHDLSYLTFTAQQGCALPRGQSSASWLVCARCRRKGTPVIFEKYPCSDHTRPLRPSVLASLGSLCKNSPENLDAAVSAFRCTTKEKQQVKDAASKTGPRRNTDATVEAAESAGHEIAQILPNTIMHRPDSSAKRVPSAYFTCTKCWKVNPLGAVKIWSVPCEQATEGRGLAAQGRYWRSLTQQQRKVLAKIWKVSIKQVNKHFSIKSRSSGIKPTQHTDRKRLKGLNGVRVGEAAHPGPRQDRRSRRNRACSFLKIWTINTGGALRAWQLFDFLQDPEKQPYPDIIAIQEASFHDPEFQAFAAKARQCGYHAFHSGAAPAGNRLQGGVATLIRRELPCSVAWHHISPAGAALATWVGNLLFFSTYLPPKPEALEVVEELTAVVSALPQDQLWLMGADFNFTPPENILQHTLSPVGLHMSFPDGSTRWEGNRCLDYFIGNLQVSNTCTLSYKIADHLIVQGDVDVSFRKVPAFELSPVPRLRAIEVNRELWDQVVTDVWKELHAPLNANQDVNATWEHINRELWETLAIAYHRTHGRDCLPLQLLRKGKPTKVIIREKQFSCRRTLGCFATNKRRCLQNLLARLLEVRRRGLWLRDLQDIDPTLARKIYTSPHFNPHIPLANNIVTIQRALESCANEEREHRFAAWRNKMADDKAALAWLRRKPQVVSPAVCVSKGEQIASSVQEAIHNIIVFWRKIWHRTPVDFDAVWPRIAQQIPHRNAGPWQPLTGAHLSRAAHDCRNRASGLDGWTSFEMSLFCEDMWECVAEFYNNHCLKVGKVPDIWKAFRQIQISKGAPLSSDGSTCVNDLRPISVSSLMWRVCQKAQFAHSDCQKWIFDTFPHYFYGGIKGRGTDDAIAPLLHMAQKGHFIGTLDLSKAFDMASPQLAGRILRHVGMPEHILAPILDVWSNQFRWIQYMDEIYPQHEFISNSLPQGDSFSMLGMSALLLPAALAIQQEFPMAKQVLYADDRSFAVDHAVDAMQITTRWHTWATMLGLQENRHKAQYWHQAAAGQNKLVQAGCPADQVQTDMRILGYHFRALQNRKINQSEATRIKDSERQMLRIRALPGTVKRKSQLARMTVSPKASWGWVCKRPAVSDCAPFIRAAKELFFWPKHGSMDLLLMICGHHWDLQFMATANSVRIFHRYCKKTLEALGPWPKKLSGWTATLRQGMLDLGWNEICDLPWTWKHEGLRVNLSLNPTSNLWCREGANLQHQLRESWRFCKFEAWKASGRKDAEPCQDVTYSSERLKILQKKHLTSHELAVATGAFVSPARFVVMHENQSEVPDSFPGCPWCGMPAESATFDHVIWRCPRAVFPSDLRESNCDALEARIGWPQTHSDWTVMSWMAKVRETILLERW